MHDHRTLLGVIVVLLGCLSALPTAEAARKKKPRTAQLQLETYPALEEVEVAAEATPREIRVSRTSMSGDAGASKPVASSTSVAYDQVPVDKTDMIAARLKLVEMILRESGRAYDYRTLTSSQLRRILDEVRSSAKLAE